MYWSPGPPLNTHSAPPGVPPYKPRTVPAGASTGVAGVNVIVLPDGIGSGVGRVWVSNESIW